MNEIVYDDVYFQMMKILGGFGGERQRCPESKMDGRQEVQSPSWLLIGCLNWPCLWPDIVLCLVIVLA